MPPSSNQTGTTASVVLAILGLFFFTKKVVRARALGEQSSPSASHRPRGTGSPSGGSTAFAVGLLDVAIPRDDRPGGPFPRVMINDACISRAVQEVSRKLVVSLRDAEKLPPGVVRAYVSELYQDVYDAACAACRPHLDVRVLLPLAAPVSGSSPSRSRTSPASSEKPPAGGDVSAVAKSATVATVSPNAATTAANGSGWATREVAELAPDLEVLFSDEPQGSGNQAALNAERIRAGFPPVNVVSLESVAKRAYRAEYFYAEDALSDIPTFSSVACGGTFDRLHGGHKKLLTLAASMCTGGKLTVGVTSDAMLKSKSNAHMVTSLPERLEGVQDFLRTLNPQMQMRVEEITDPFGPPVAEEAFDAIAVSSETVSGAEKINELRAQKGFRPLAVAVTRRMAAATLSSSYLRRAAETQHDTGRKTSGRSRKRG